MELINYRSLKNNNNNKEYNTRQRTNYKMSQVDIDFDTPYTRDPNQIIHIPPDLHNNESCDNIEPINPTRPSKWWKPFSDEEPTKLEEEEILLKLITIVGNSMSDTLTNGKIYKVEPVKYNNEKEAIINSGDIICAMVDNKIHQCGGCENCTKCNNIQYMAKRVVAVAGDTVITLSDRMIYVIGGNNSEEHVLEVNKQLAYQWRQSAEENPELEIPQLKRIEKIFYGHVYVMGDNVRSRDSRDFGMIPVSSIKGKIKVPLRERLWRSLKKYL